MSISLQTHHGSEVSHFLGVVKKETKLPPTATGLRTLRCLLVTGEHENGLRGLRPKEMPRTDGDNDQVDKEITEGLLPIGLQSHLLRRYLDLNPPQTPSEKVLGARD